MWMTRVGRTQVRRGDVTAMPIGTLRRTTVTVVINTSRIREMTLVRSWSCVIMSCCVFIMRFVAVIDTFIKHVTFD